MTTNIRSIQLPSRRTFRLEVRDGAQPKQRRKDAPLFSELFDVVAAGDMHLFAGNSPASVGSLNLCDFHALRAIATKLGLIDEETVSFPCRNCQAPLMHAPSAHLPLGPFVDGELDDPELDALLDLTTSHEIPPIDPSASEATESVLMVARTADEAAALHEALRKRRFRLTAAVVRAMGVAKLNDETDVAAIARRLASAHDDAWNAITNLFLRAHYPLRLFSIALCPTCGARNDVDAPYEREFEPHDDLEGQLNRSRQSANAPLSNRESFPDFDGFDQAAHDLATAILGDLSDELVFVVEGGVPACDDGGEPLLGSYVPPYEGDASNPARSGEITVFYRTFRAVWDEEGPFDWRAELKETIEHELEHHLSGMTGFDPTDEEERHEIAREAARVLGEKDLTRIAVRNLGSDAGDFVRRTWPLWILFLAIAVIVAFCGSSAN